MIGKCDKYLIFNLYQLLCIPIYIIRSIYVYKSILALKLFLIPSHEYLATITILYRIDYLHFFRLFTNKMSLKLHLLIKLLAILFTTATANFHEIKTPIHRCLRLDGACILKSWWGLGLTNSSLNPTEIICDGVNLPQLITRRLEHLPIVDNEDIQGNVALAAITRSRYVKQCEVTLLGRMSPAEIRSTMRQVGNLIPGNSWTIILNDGLGKISYFLWTDLF